jgi:eukaryotic-like serine/threonine-protein kinase
LTFSAIGAKLKSPRGSGVRCDRGADASGETVMSLRPCRTFNEHSRSASLSLRRSNPSALDLSLLDLTTRWERGETPTAEEYVGWLDSNRPDDLIELAYREFRLAEIEGLAPDPDAFGDRFPALRRVLAIHGAFLANRTQTGDEISCELPVVGDEIGPFRLIGELGRGGFARVFLAAQSDLDDRYVVVKVTTRHTPESRLLARARHPHIVEVLSYDDVNDGMFQIICMPFLGGATLSTVLAERQRRGGRSSSGRNLLEDLDRVSAHGYPVPPAAGRPAREVIAGLSYPRAVAWIVARLAEALDHAYSRGVLHGDVKPSNVLLTADGSPMLFDFNLSVDWRPSVAGGTQLPGEVGGTLAYMAPERLLAIAAPETNPTPSPAVRHQADVYALGIVLLELLTGQPPLTPDDHGDGKPPARSVRELASAYITARGAPAKGGFATPHHAHVSAGLRAILRRCLAIDPADRYHHSSELAEDLDRWRTDRPLLYARDPVLTTGLSRWTRRHRLVSIALATSLIVATLASFYYGRVAAQDRGQLARDSFELMMAALDHDVIHVRRPGFGVLRDEGDVTRVSRDTLNRFRVLGATDWRKSTEFADLEPGVRDDMESFLLVHAYRFAHVLGSRPDAPDDWREGLRALERMDADRFSALQPELRRLRGLLNEPTPSQATRSSSSLWMNAYLLGVVAEARDDDEGLVEACRHYAAALAARPSNFWANYRMAAVVFARAARCRVTNEPIADDTLQFYSVAASRLKWCVDQRPQSASLRLCYANSLFYVQRFDESIVQSDRTRKIDGQHAETFASLAFLRVPLGQYDEAVADIDRYDLLSGFAKNATTTSSPQASLVHRGLADEFMKAGRGVQALTQYDRALELDPTNLAARYQRASQRVALGRDDADRDFESVTEHPLIEEGLSLNPNWLNAFYRVAKLRTNQGRTREAIAVAARAREFSRLYHIQEVESSYNLAATYAAAANVDESLIPEAIAQLKRAYHDAPDDQRARLQRWFRSDRTFDELRASFGSSALYEKH